jgi:hypothetical protein
MAIVAEYDELIVEVWELLKEHVSAKLKDDACQQLLTIFENNGFSPEDCDNLRGVDRDIDRNLDVLYESEDDDYSDEYDE